VKATTLNIESRFVVFGINRTYRLEGEDVPVNALKAYWGSGSVAAVILNCNINCRGILP
jgi:hypothetical protein